MKKGHGSGEADVEVEVSEHWSSENSDEHSDFNLETRSIPEKEAQRYGEELRCLAGSQYHSYRQYSTKKSFVVLHFHFLFDMLNVFECQLCSQAML